MRFGYMTLTPASGRGSKNAAHAGRKILLSLAAESDVILVCVGYDRELRELLSDKGLLKDTRRGTIIAVLSTVHPRTMQELAQQGKALD